MPVEVGDVLNVDQNCRRCELASLPKRKVCIPPEGEPGGLLAVGEAPGGDENATGRPFIGASGKYLRMQLGRYWKGPVAFANAVNCQPSRDGPNEKHMEACAPYLRSTVSEVAPKRVIALGGWAYYALTGRSPPALSSRRGYAYLASGAPVFFLIHPAAGLRNRFIRSWLDEDIRWALTCPDPVPAPHRAVCHVVETLDDALHVERLVQDAAFDGQWFAYDVETEGWAFNPGFAVVSVALCVRGSDTAYVWTREALEPDSPAAVPLRRIMSDPDVKKIGHNVKHDDLAVLSALGVKVNGVSGDTLMWRKQLWSDADGDLDTAAEGVGMGGHKVDVQSSLRSIVAGLRSKKQLLGESQRFAAAAAAVHMGEPPLRWAFGLLEPDQRDAYCSRDAVVTARLGDQLETLVLADEAAKRMWEERISRDVRSFEQVEAWGIAVDRASADTFRTHMKTQLDAINLRLVSAGLNPASHSQVSAYLFEKLKLPALFKTGGGKPSTAEAALAPLRGQHPIVGDILDWRGVSKLHGTYAAPLLGFVRSDGRVHPNYKIHGTRTGRPSCSDPNLLNIPRAESVEGKMARDCYVAEQGSVLLQADYSQLELRIAAMLSGDQKMIEIFNSGVDYHMRTAQMISMLAWRIPPEKVEKRHRSAAKCVNFGLIYGLRDEALAAQIGCRKSEAAIVRKAVLGNFKRLSAWINERLAETRRTGMAWTWWDGKPARCRSLHQIADQDGEKVTTAENSASNTPVQGTASEFCLASVDALVEWIQSTGIEDRCKLVLTVYDSILLEVRRDFVAEAADKMRAVMTGWNSGGVPLHVDMEIAEAWGSLKKYEPSEWELV